MRYIRDTGLYPQNAIDDGKSVLFEALLGALRDIDFGIYPVTSASSTLAAYVFIGAGVPFASLNQVLGIMKAYSRCVGADPFPCELFGEEGSALREAGQNTVPPPADRAESAVLMLLHLATEPGCRDAPLWR